jgi:hypothetical protein
MDREEINQQLQDENAELKEYIRKKEYIVKTYQPCVYCPRCCIVNKVKNKIAFTLMPHGLYEGYCSVCKFVCINFRTPELHECGSEFCKERLNNE